MNERHSDLLESEYVPKTIVNRDEEMSKLINSLTGIDPRNTHVYAPRGCGKTLVAQVALDSLPPHTASCYVSCVKHDTQYRVLVELYQALTGQEIGTGYHTSQLQNAVEEEITNEEIVVVLDEIDFLFENGGNGGNDLLYFLSRVHGEGLSILTISANYPVLCSILDARTCSLQPRNIHLEPYSVNETYRILDSRCRNALDENSFSKEALTYVASNTSNIRFGFHWLHQATKNTERRIITERIVRNARQQAVQCYRDVLLADFSSHHNILLEVLEQLTPDGKSVRAGAIYERYTKVCRMASKEPLTNRRISDFLKHLELLGIVEANYHYGGKEGKTRKIRIREPAR